VNPFEDMVARAQIAPRATADDGQKKKDLKKRKKPAGKNVLSFGGDDGDDSLAPVVKKAKVNPKFAASVDDGPSDKIIKPVVHREQTKDTTSLPKRNETVYAAEAVRDTETPDRVANRETLGAQQPVSAAKPDMEMDDEDEDERGERENKRARAAALALEKTKAEFDALKKSMKRSNEVQAPSKEKPRSALEAMIPETSTRGRKRGGKGGNDEQGALDLFKAFKERLEGLPAIEDIRIDHSDKSQASKEDIAGTQDGGMKKSGVATEINDDEEAILCDLHFIPNCQSCKSWDTGDDVADGDKDEQGTDWMAHKLSFAKDTLGKDLEWKRKMQEIEVIDPREKTREILGERKKGKEKSRAR
jgi:peptidyl-prolyl cis-trans isomerase SDCCAG10